MSRPSSFKPEYAEQARKLCELGATDSEMADFFEVDVRTVHRWKLDHEEFCHSIKAGKAHADERVERSLYQKATGYDFTEEQAVKVKVAQYEETVEVVAVTRHQPAETTAQIFWLKNRRSEAWRDKTEQVVRHEQMTDEQLDARIRQIAGSLGLESGAFAALGGAEAKARSH